MLAWRAACGGQAASGCFGERHALGLGGSVAAQPVQTQIIRKIELSGVGGLIRAPDVRRAFQAIADLGLHQKRFIAAQVYAKAAGNGCAIDNDLLNDAYRALVLGFVERHLADAAAGDTV